MARLRITKLTAAQVARLPEIRDEWLAVGLSTAPADREAAIAGVARAYERAGLPTPPIAIWLDSPMAGSIGAAMIAHAPRSVWDQVWDQVGGQVRDQVGDQVGGQVRDQVWDQVGGQVRDQVRGQVRDQVWDQVGGQVWDQVGGQVRDQVWDQVGGQVRGQVYRAGYGQHDANWLGFVAALGEFGATGAERLDGLSQVARTAGWWWAFRGLVILTERPRVLHRDSEHRLHCEDGPALLYPDGWGIWAWHGARVPRQVIEAPATLLPGQITNERNAEVRRVMLERYGADRYLQGAGVTAVHRDDWGTLWRVELPGDEPLVMVQVTNSTPEPDGTFHDYWLRVPPTMRTAHEAVAWTFEESPTSYAPAMQT